ncbi:MAG: hypothetical protein Q8S55_04660 [Methylococcaceae bacterium]|nr:hypothetical protein [Methylococcaceae bacterium]
MVEKQTTATPKNKGGRPRKDKKGALLWVSAEFVDSMTAYLELLKQQQTKRQAKQ